MIADVRRRMMETLAEAESNIIIDARDGDANATALMEVIKAQGWSESPLFMTKEEAEAVTTIGTYFSGNLAITDFSALKYFTGLTKLNRAFKNCTNLVYVEIPSGVTSLRETFYGCTSLQLETLHDGITSIDYYAFHKCANIKVTQLPSVLQVLGMFTFSESSLSGELYLGCDIGESGFWKAPITSITINGGTKIGRKAFRYCGSLENVYMGDSITTIGDAVFDGCTSLKNIRLSNNITSIPSYTFGECVFEEIEIPNSVTTIGTSAFNACKKLKEIILPNGITSLPALAFNGCTALSSITLPNTLQRLDGSQIFNWDSNLKMLEFPASLTYIYSSAFSNLYNIKLVFNNPIPCELGGDIFGGISSSSSFKTTIYVPDDSLTAYQTAEIWADYANIIKPMSSL